MKTLQFDEVINAIKDERDYQDLKWGSIEEKAQSLAGHLLTIQAELDEAKAGWQKNVPGKHAALRELIQVAAVCIAALEQYGLDGNG